MKKWRIRIFAACIIAYTAAYICRVNFSIAIPGLQAELGLSNASVGLIGTSFFWVYALGQLINGYLGDIFSSRIFVFTGLIASALINIIFGSSSMLFIMIMLWGANGIFQSMLWGPIVKTLSKWFSARWHNTIGFGMSIAVIAGYLVAWSSSGLIMSCLSWRWVFWLAGLIVLSLAFVWYIMVRDKPEDAGIISISEADKDEEIGAAQSTKNLISGKPHLKEIVSNHMIFVALSGVSQGIIKESILLWSPKLLMDTHNLSLKSTVAIVLIIPLTNILGIILSSWLNKRLGQMEKLTIVVLMLGSFVTALLLAFFIHSSTIVSILLLACNSALIFGINPLMTAVIPFKYSDHRKVSVTAGFIDFSIYVGAGLAGILTGLAADILGWSKVFVMWCAVSALGALTMYISVLLGNKSLKNK